MVWHKCTSSISTIARLRIHQLENSVAMMEVPEDHHFLVKLGELLQDPGNK